MTVLSVPSSIDSGRLRKKPLNYISKLGMLLFTMPHGKTFTMPHRILRFH